MGGSSVSIATRLGAERPEFVFRQGQEIFSFNTTSRQNLGPSQALIQCVAGALSPGVKVNFELRLTPRLRILELYNHSSTSLWHGA
jgi:hypothetical protein